MVLEMIAKRISAIGKKTLSHSCGKKGGEGVCSKKMEEYEQPKSRLGTFSSSTK